MMNDRLNKLLELADSKGFDVTWYPHYCSRGYTSPKEGVVTGNWNDKTRYRKESNDFETLDNTPSRFARLFEKLGLEVDWEDEYTSCSDCGGAIRTVHDSYGWQPEYIEMNCDTICNDCLMKDKSLIEEYLESKEGDSRTALNNNDINPEDFGYHKLDIDFEHGFHHGQDADPKLIGKALDKVGVSRYLFVITGVGQFDIDFTVYIHEDEQEKYADALRSLEEEPTNGPSNAEALKRGLQQAAIQTDELRKNHAEGVVYSSIKGDGTAETRMVSPEEFVEGIKND